MAGASLAAMPNAAKKPSQIEDAVVNLRANVERFNLLLGRLDDKLSPILRGKVPPNDRIEERKDTEEKVGLARVIHEQTTNIRLMADEVERIINRIEL